MDKLSIILGISLTANVVLIGVLIAFRQIYNMMNDAWHHLMEDMLNQILEDAELDDDSEELN